MHVRQRIAVRGCVQVEASVIRPEHGTSETTNTFSFTCAPLPPPHIFALRYNDTHEELGSSCFLLSPSLLPGVRKSSYIAGDSDETPHHVASPLTASAAPTTHDACSFETDLAAAPGDPGGRGPAVRPLKRVLPATEQQAADIERFCPRHYDID